ncbi:MULTISPECIES: universal stress protein [unclassified Streptomyces]|nr:MULTISPECIES: universal stress protein [Streptomyces]MDN5384246.1 universal stress protein [Streptomyces sp. LB8]
MRGRARGGQRHDSRSPRFRGPASPTARSCAAHQPELFLPSRLRGTRPRERKTDRPAALGAWPRGRPVGRGGSARADQDVRTILGPFGPTWPGLSEDCGRAGEARVTGVCPHCGRRWRPCRAPSPVGLDGSSESQEPGRCRMGAREAKPYGVPLKFLHVRQLLAQVPFPGTETNRDWIKQLFGESAEGLRLRHAGVGVIIERVLGRPVEVLCQAAKDADLLVLSFRALGDVGGFALGSVGLFAVARGCSR